MKRHVLAAVAALALAGAGLALADGIESKAAKAVSASFDATTATNLRTTTCTNSDGTFADTKGTYTGIASSSDASLSGPIRVDLRSRINTSKDLGTVSGKLRIDTASGKDTVLKFDGVYAAGAIAGLGSGHAQPPYSRLLANISAAYNPAGGLTGGKIGNSSGGGAVAMAPGRCKPAKASTERLEVRGTVTALSPTHVTAAGVSCAIPASLAARVADRITVGSRVEMKCTLSGGVYTLVKISVKK